MKRALKQAFKPKDNVHCELHTTNNKNKNERMKIFPQFILLLLFLVTVSISLNAQDKKQTDTLQVSYVNFNHLKWADRALGASLLFSSKEYIDNATRNNRFVS